MVPICVCGFYHSHWLQWSLLTYHLITHPSSTPFFLSTIYFPSVLFKNQFAVKILIQQAPATSWCCARERAQICRPARCVMMQAFLYSKCARVGFLRCNDVCNHGNPISFMALILMGDAVLCTKLGLITLFIVCVVFSTHMSRVIARRSPCHTQRTTCQCPVPHSAATGPSPSTRRYLPKWPPMVNKGQPSTLPWHHVGVMASQITDN